MPSRQLDQVRSLAEQSVDQVCAAFSDFRWEDPAYYGGWLAQTYHFVRHATRVLAHAAAMCPLSEEAYHLELLKGVGEEKGHELLALNDLRHIGLKIEDFPELPETAAYHQTLYYAIDHAGPASLMGWFMPLEGFAALRLSFDFQRVLATYPPRAASFLRVHCEHDVGHFEDGLKGLERFDALQLDVVRRGIELSVPLYCNIIRRIREIAAATKTKRQAA